MQFQTARLFCGAPLAAGFDRLAAMADAIDAQDPLSRDCAEREVAFHVALVEQADCQALLREYRQVMRIEIFYRTNQIMCVLPRVPPDLHRRYLETLAGASPAMKNVLIAGKYARFEGGGMYIAGGDARLDQVTVADNPGDGIYQTGGSTAISNSIVWGNLTDIDPANASVVEMDVLRSRDAEEYTRIAFFKGRGMMDGSLVSLDTSRASPLPDVRARAPETAPFALADDEPLHVRIFIDRSVVEVFVNDRQCVAAYKEKTGVDPTAIDIDDGQPYLDWIQWRADFFTELLRELARRLERVEKKIGQKVPVTARVPGNGFLWNLAQGMDVHTWIAEGLIDELQLDPLECAAGRASHDVKPYLALCRAYGIPVFGGVNVTTGVNMGCGRDDYTPVAGLRRAIGLLRADMDGIELYEAEIMSRGCERRWLIPLLADPDRAENWLKESNLDAVFPVNARNAALGHDNHWFAPHQTLHGARAKRPRGTKQPL